jgi:hypothetical protein
MNLNNDVVDRRFRLGRSTSVIPAVPAASSVTTIAFIRHLPVSSPRLCRQAFAADGVHTSVG